jgi:hypothetical protein
MGASASHGAAPRSRLEKVSAGVTQKMIELEIAGSETGAFLF